MPATRSQLPPVAGFDTRIRPGYALTNVNRRLARWAIGTGLLAFHLTIFAIALLVAFCWGLIANPQDLGAMHAFRYWGIVAVVHTILAGGGALLWKILQVTDDTRPNMLPARAYTVPVRPPTRPRPALMRPTDRPITAQPARPSRWASLSGGTRRTPWAIRPVEQNWPQQAPFMRNASVIDAAGADKGEVTWPESAPRSTELRVSAAPEADEVVSVNTAARNLNPGSTDSSHRAPPIRNTAGHGLRQRPVRGSRGARNSLARTPPLSPLMTRPRPINLERDRTRLGSRRSGCPERSHSPASSPASEPVVTPGRPCRTQ